MQISDTKLMEVVYHEVGHIMAAIGLGVPVYSTYISSIPEGYLACAGKVHWARPDTTIGRTSAQIIAVSGLMSEWMNCGDKASRPITKTMHATFYGEYKYSQDLEVFDSNGASNFWECLQRSRFILKEMQPWVDHLAGMLLDPKNHDRLISQEELLEMAGVVLTKEGKPVTNFVDGCSYALVNVND